MLVVVRGDHQVNDIKLANALGAPFRAAREDEFAQRIGPAGSMGPVGADVPVLLDDAVAPGPYVAGANRDGTHLRGVEPGRDFPFKRGDVRRRVEPGDTVDGHPIRIEPAIEVGNIFKLGTRYSEPSRRHLPRRVRRRAADLDGLLRHRPGAHLRRRRRAVRRRAGDLVAALDRAVRRPPRRPRQARAPRSARSPSGSTASCARRGSTSIYDDREDVGPGGKFADAELLGCPLRLTVGQALARLGRDRGRRSGAARRAASLPLEGAAQAAAGAVADPGLTPSSGAGPRPRADAGRGRAGAPDVPAPVRARPLRAAAAARRSPASRWRPWTIPNAIGFVRLALIPVFLVLALQLRRRHRRGPAGRSSPSSAGRTTSTASPRG